MWTNGVRSMLVQRIGPPRLSAAPWKKDLTAITTTTTQQQQWRGKRTAAILSNKNKKKPLKSASMASASSSAVRGNEIGLRPVDYSIPPPIYPTPPPPPPKPGLRRLVFPGGVILMLGFIVYIYVNGDSDSIEYWNAMETGQALPDDYFNDDDDEEFEEENEEKSPVVDR